jgi:hypothetical protein
MCAALGLVDEGLAAVDEAIAVRREVAAEPRWLDRSLRIRADLLRTGGAIPTPTRLCTKPTSSAKPTRMSSRGAATRPVSTRLATAYFASAIKASSLAAMSAERPGRTRAYRRSVVSTFS